VKHRGDENDTEFGQRDFREAKRKFGSGLILTEALGEHRWNVSRPAATIGLHAGRSLQEKAFRD